MALAGWSSEEPKNEGRRRESESEGTGRAKRCDTRWYLPPVGVRVSRKRCPEDVVAMNVWAFEQLSFYRDLSKD
jgi:hypothetical protein